MIQIYRLTMRFPSGIEALRDVSLRVHEGELVFLSGRSGAGKTTLFDLVTAELRPTEGQILVAGRNLATLKTAQVPFLRRGIGRLWEDIRLLPDRSVHNNISVSLEISGVDARQARRRVDQVLELVGMEKHAASYPSWLSSAEQQRVALARAIVHEPSLVLADEPTGHLDPDAAHAILQMLRDLKSRGTTVVIATRDARLPARFEERVIVLNKGFLIEDDGETTSAGGV